ncbi:MAG: DNA replication and repair protein RecF [Candidatus Saccharibacteria bacterium]|nr:DNA replication and repair protein RecF [Candidatus Saccharibacteria bacterium]
MIIKSISLVNFRNHSNYHLECNPDTTLILGKNGCGKTSVLEAIYILTRGKSFRATDPDILKRGTDFYHIELESEDGEKYSVSYDGKTKNFIISDKKSHRLPKNYKYPIILFLPSDLNLVSGSPSRHREYFDRIFGQLSEEYDSALNKYEKTLRQRNELLKTEQISETELFSWNLLLSKYGSKISLLRKYFINLINETLNSTYDSIAGSSDAVFVKYETETNDLTESSYLKQLDLNSKKDLYLGYTSFGIHRDDFKFIFNQNLADGSASRGETRSIILALKFVEANLIKEKLGKNPIVLLDDVFSELDETRRQSLVQNFKNHQIIITSVKDGRY